MSLFRKKEKNKSEDISHLKSGIIVEICKVDENGDEVHLYNSTLKEVISHNKVMIAAPKSKKGMIVKLPEDVKYAITFKSKNGLFKNMMQVQDYNIMDNRAYIIVKLVEHNTKIQRRSCFRLETQIPFKFGLIHSNSDEVFFMNIPLNLDGITEDISDGGIKFVTNKQLVENQFIKCKITLNYTDIITIGKILVVEKLEGKPFEYCYKVKFESIQRQDKEFISKYIFDQQIIISKKVKK